MPAKIKISTKTGFKKINTEFNKSEEIIEPSLLMISQRARKKQRHRNPRQKIKMSKRAQNR